MAQLNFPDNPIDGQLYPNPCPAGVTQYRWDVSTGIWRIVGVATGVNPGQYGNEVTVGQFTVDVAGNITQAANIPIQGATVTQPGIVQLTSSTDSIAEFQALTAKGGKILQDQIGNLNTCIVPDHVNVVAALNDLQNQTIQLQNGALIWCGYYNALEGDISFVSIAGQRLGYRIGQELPSPSNQNGGDFFIVTVPGNPYIAGDYNAPDVNIETGNWIVSETVKWTEVDATGKVFAQNVLFTPTAPLTATNVQNAIYQITQLFRTGIGGATISPTKPSNPYPGQLWWDDDDGIFYIFYTDINSSQWVELGGGGSQGLAAGGGTVYEVRTGVGLIGGPINTEGTISLVSAGVSTDQLGGVFVPPNKGLTLLKNGELTVSPATDNLLGGIIVGENLTITPEGVLNATGGGGGGGTADETTLRPVSGISTANNVQEGIEAVELQVQDRIEFAEVLGLGLTVNVTDSSPTSNDGTTLQIIPEQSGLNKVGVVALTDDLEGTSNTVALTQSAGNVLQQRIAALVGVNTLAGTYDAQLGEMIYVTPAGAANGFVVGQNCPPAAVGIDNYYVIVTVAGDKTPPGAPAAFAGAGDWYICQADAGAGEVWFLIDYQNNSVAAENVSLQAVPGLSASNVQGGINELTGRTNTAVQTVYSTGGIDVTTAPVNAGYGYSIGLGLEPATSADLGGVYIVPNRGLALGSDGGVTLLPPTTDGLQIGGVKAGRNITIDSDGTINSSGGGGGGGAAIDVSVTAIPGIEFATNVQRALEALELQAQDRVEFVQATSVGLQITVSDPGPTSNDGTTAEIALDFGSVAQRGIVQLTNDLRGTSESLAVTQLAASQLNSKVEALVGANVLAGTYNSNTGRVVSTTPAGAAAGFVVGQQAPAAASVPDNYYLIVTVTGGSGPPGATIPPNGIQSGDWFIVENQSGVGAAWITIDYENRVVDATQVNLSPVPGLTATNVQQGIAQLQTEFAETVTTASSLNDGITVVTSPVNAAFGKQVTVKLNQATPRDLGGVYVPDNQGISLTPSGAISLAPPTSTVIGGVKAGNNITIEADGTINAAGGSSGNSVSIKLIDSLTPQFDGSRTSFTLQSGGANLSTAVQIQNLFISIGGVNQTPNVAFTWNPSSSTINFTSAPPTGSSFDGRAFVIL